MKKTLSILVLAAMLLSAATGCANIPENTGIIAASASADKYATWLSDRMGETSDEVIVCDNNDAVSYGLDLSGINAGGYIIRKSGDSAIIAGKDTDGLDAAVRYYAKYASEGDMSVTKGEGYKVKSLKIDGNDISDYSVYVPSEIPGKANAENVNYAADVLIEHVAEATGVTLEKTNTPDGRRIVFAYDGETYGEEAFNLSVSDGNLTITCGTKRGPLYGAYGFLEECVGYRFLTRGVEYLYEADEINIEDGFDHTEGLNTPFVWRDTYTNIDGKDNLYPAGAMTASFPQSVLALHNTGTWTHNWISSARYGYGEGSDKNHSAYKLIPSVPDLSTPCFSDPDVFDECLGNLRNYIKELENMGYKWGINMPKISISQNDTAEWCNCEKCMESLDDHKARCATLIDFISRLSDELIDEYPEIEFWTLAYLRSTTKPPENMEIPDNLTICYCHYLVCYNHHVSEETCSNYKKEIIGYYNDWVKVAKNVEVWYYACAFTYSLTPAPIIYQMKEDVRYFAETGASGFFMQNEETTLGFDDLSSYLSAELLWNPYMTDEEYQAKIDEFCYIFYGDGYEHISEYVRHLEEAGDRNDCWSALTDAPFAVYNFDYLASNFDYFIYLFESAIEKCNNAEQEARLKRLSCHMYFNCVAAQFDTMKKGTSEEKAVLTERYKLMYDRLYEIRDTAMFGIFTNDKLPDVFSPTVNPLDWLTQISSSWGDYNSQK